MRYERHNKNFIVTQRKDNIYLIYIGENPITFTEYDTGVGFSDPPYILMAYYSYDNVLRPIRGTIKLYSQEPFTLYGGEIAARIVPIQLSLEKPVENLDF